jgi:hypothetical protein
MVANGTVTPLGATPVELPVPVFASSADRANAADSPAASPVSDAILPYVVAYGASAKAADRVHFVQDDERRCAEPAASGKRRHQHQLRVVGDTSHQPGFPPDATRYTSALAEDTGTCRRW